jgi:SAM-dependent methyltransferase
LAGGRQRGQPVIRYYWEAFLALHREDLRGRALEIGGTSTLVRLGGSAITRAEAIDLVPRPGVDIVADLSRADALPADTYDCFVAPFTMHLIYDVESALYHAVRILKPGGTLLVNFPCVDYYFAAGLDMGTGRPLFVFWWFTPLHVENLLRRIGLTGDHFQLVIDGNLFSRVAYQMNMPVEELTSGERNHRDEGHPLLISARIVKPAEWQGARPEPRDPWVPATTPAMWNRETGHYPRT